LDLSRGWDAISTLRTMMNSTPVQVHVSFTEADSLDFIPAAAYSGAPSPAAYFGTELSLPISVIPHSLERVQHQYENRKTVCTFQNNWAFRATKQFSGVHMTMTPTLHPFVTYKWYIIVMTCKKEVILTHECDIK
jgi:hypothetical protein